MLSEEDEKCEGWVVSRVVVMPRLPSFRQDPRTLEYLRSTRLARTLEDRSQSSTRSFNSALKSYYSTHLHFLAEMGKKRKQLSQAEVWDDSALLQSWDDALAEYKVLPISNHASFLANTQYSSITVYMRAANVSKI